LQTEHAVPALHSKAEFSEMPLATNNEAPAPHDQDNFWEPTLPTKDELPATPTKDELPALQFEDNFWQPTLPTKDELPARPTKDELPALQFEEMPPPAKDQQIVPKDQDAFAYEVLPGGTEKNAAAVSLPITCRPWHSRPSVATWLHSRKLCLEPNSLALGRATKEFNTQKSQHPWPRLPSVGTWMMHRPPARANHEENDATVASKLLPCTDGVDGSRPLTNDEEAPLAEVKKET